MISFLKPDQSCSKSIFLLSQTDLSAYNNVTAFLAPGVVSISFPSCGSFDAKSHIAYIVTHLAFSDWFTDGSAG